MIPNYSQPLRTNNYPPYCNLFDFEREHCFPHAMRNLSQRFRKLTNNFIPMIFVRLFRDPQPFLVSNIARVKSNFEPYLLLSPLTPLDDENEKQVFKNESSLPCLSSKINDHNQSCSTLDTFTETPPHFNFDDYQLVDQSPQQISKIQPENNSNSSIINQTTGSYSN